MPYRKLAIILGNCLFPDHKALSPDEDTLFFMAEDSGLCTHFRYHKHKLVMFLSAMRSHADDIGKRWPVDYHRLTAENFEDSYETKLASILKRHPTIEEVVTYDIEDHFFDKRIRDCCAEHAIQLTIVDSSGFLTSKADFTAYNQSVNRPFMHTFYQQQRRKLNILVDHEGKPLHGKWSFDEDNRKKLPKDIHIPPQPQSKQTEHTRSVITLVNDLFPDHPGDTQNFYWATTRKQALKNLNVFLSERLQDFGPYEDAIDRAGVFLFHSALSPYLNMGLVTPKEIVQRTLAYAEKHDAHFPSLEGFIRQIIGWREFIRGIYHEYDGKLQTNFFGHKRRMNKCWYDGTTGIPPLDDSIHKALKHGYTHHIERLMILGNIMLLCEIHPEEVYQWFMEMYVDSADWVMAPNVYGMSQFADGGIFATKPYIGGSNYILKMSNYSKTGDWPDTVNGLYWRFISRNRKVFEKNPRMSMMARTLDKMDAGKKERLFSLADQFIASATYMEKEKI